MARPLRKVLPWEALVDDGRTVLLKNGGALAGWSFEGLDPRTCSHDETLAYNEAINRALQSIATSDWTLHLEARRVAAAPYQVSVLTANPVLAALEGVRARRHNSPGARLETQTSLYLSYQPAERRASGGRWWERLLTGAPPPAAIEQGDGFVHLFNRRCGAALGPLALAIKLERLSGGELLSGLRGSVTGRSKPLEAPADPGELLDHYLVMPDLRTGLAPRFDTGARARHLRVLTIGGFPQRIYPAMLDALTGLGCEVRLSVRYLPLNGADAEAHFNGAISKWARARFNLLQMARRTSQGEDGAPALSGTEAVIQESDEASSAGSAIRSLARAKESLGAGDRVYGFLTTTVFLYDVDGEALAAAEKAATEAIEAVGLSVTAETYHADKLIRAAMPGNRADGLRRPAVSSFMVSRFAPFYGKHRGHVGSTHPAFAGYPALITCRTAGGCDPFDLNLHDGEKGHTAVVGPTTSGKTVVLEAIVAGWLAKYPGTRVVLFDARGSNEVFTELVGGHHVTADLDGGGGRFAPLAALAGHDDFNWAKNWLGTILELHGVAESPAREREVTEALRQLGERAPGARSMSDLLSGFSSDDLRSIIGKYTEGEAYGELFDGTEDALSEARLVTYELHALYKAGAKVALPALDYLFHNTERQLSASTPTLMVIDESWLSMTGEERAARFMARMIEDRVRTLRRYAGSALVIATQGVEEFVKAPERVQSAIVNNSANFIFLPDPGATTRYREAYASLGLSPQHCEQLRRLTRRRDYMVAPLDGQERAYVFDLDLSPLELATFGHSQQDSRLEMQRLRRADPEGWRTAWYANHGIDPAAIFKTPQLEVER